MKDSPRPSFVIQKKEKLKEALRGSVDPYNEEMRLGRMGKRVKAAVGEFWGAWSGSG